MRNKISPRWGSTAVVVGILAGLLSWPTASTAQLLDNVTQTPTDTTQSLTDSTTTSAQTITGQAAAVRATVLDLLGGATTALADTGTLSGSTDARDASQLIGSITSLLTGEVLHATTIGWPDQVASEASLAGLGLMVGGTWISADLVMATATALLGAAGSGTSILDNLSINGVPVSVSGDPNQIFYITGGRVVINEQRTSPGSMAVNALHVIVDGVADVVIGSATAGIQ